MSPELIKREEFVALYTPEVSAPVGPTRFSSSERQVRDLQDRLAAERAERDRRVAEAAQRARTEAEAEVRAEWESSARAFREAAARLDEAARAEREIAQDEIVSLAVAVATKIVRREVRRDDDFVVRLVRRCLRKIAHRAKVQVRVSPSDHRRVLAALEAPNEEHGPDHEITVVEDRRVGAGGCIVETPDFVVDGTMSSQLAAAAEALRGDGA